MAGGSREARRFFSAIIFKTKLQRILLVLFFFSYFIFSPYSVHLSGSLECVNFPHPLSGSERDLESRLFIMADTTSRSGRELPKTANFQFLLLFLMIQMQILSSF